MSRERLIQWYHNYTLVIGVSSYRLVAGRFRQTWLTRCYVLVLNAFQLLTLPIMFWLTTQYISTLNWFPNLISLTPYILFSVICTSIAYTVISRSSRDSDLVELERIMDKLKFQYTSRVVHIESSLDYLFYLKFTTMLYLCGASLLTCFIMPQESRWFIFLCSFIFGNAVNIPIVSTYRYFLVLWKIAHCYQQINCRLDDLTCSAQSTLSRSLEFEELNRLWYQHAFLGRCILRLNKIYGLLMLAARFEFVAFSVINFYWGLLYSFRTDSPLYMLTFGALSYWVRTLDFYLMDAMCDLTIQYQSCPHHDVTEGLWFKELNAYLLYASTSKLSVWVCGLYEVNRKCWFQMLGSIFTFSILLLQFHLLKRDKYSL